MATNHRQTIAPRPAANAPQEVSFAVTGMTCASCVRRIEKALHKVEGVSEASAERVADRLRKAGAKAVATPAEENL